MEIALIAAVVFFVLFHSLDYLSNRFLGNDFLSTFPLIVYFFFIYANVDERVAPFYLFMAIVVLVFIVVKNRGIGINVQNSNAINVPNLEGGQTKVKGPQFYILNMVLGIGVFFLMRSMLATEATDRLQAFLGVPLLSIAALKANLGFVSTMALGNIENKFLIIVYEFLKLLRDILALVGSGLLMILFGWLPFLLPFVVPASIFLGLFIQILGPITLASVLFAIFHLAAYELVFGALFFAWSVMMIWLVLYEVTGNDIAMNVAHSLWNAFITYLRQINGGG